MDKLIRKVYINDLSLQDVKDLTRDKVPVILYDNLNINDDILNIIGERSFLLFPVSANSPSGHWIAIIYRKETHTIEYWDPYGFTIDQELRFSTNPNVERNVLGKLFLKAQQQYSVKIEYNTFKYQKLITGNNTCGKHCSFRLRMHFLTNIQYSKLMLNQSMSADWLVSIISFLKLFKTGEEEMETVKEYLHIKD